MGIIVKIYNLELTKIIAINIYYNMSIAIEHSKGLINYYDIRKKSNTYDTYKRYFKVEKISLSNFLLLNQILCFNTINTNASSIVRYRKTDKSKRQNGKINYSYG